MTETILDIDYRGGDIILLLDSIPRWAQDVPPKDMRRYQEYTRLVYPRNLDTVTSLAEVGVDVKGLLNFRSCYQPATSMEYKPMPHQWETAEFLITHPRGYNTSETRTGKTLAQAMALDYLRRIDPGAALIVCPLSVMESVWSKTIRIVDPYARVGLLRGTKKKRLEVLEWKRPYYVINYDGLVIIEDALQRLIWNKDITKVVIDELNHFGNPSAKRYKVADRLFNSPGFEIKYLWGLTGTPGADSVAVYGMTRMVNYERMLWKSKTAWQGAVQHKWGREPWQWRDKLEAPDLIHTVMQPTIRFARQTILPSLPPVVHSARESELSKEQERYYNELKRDLVVRFNRGEVITADQKSALLSKLFQICLGVVITDAGLVVIDNKPRIELLKEIINESPRKSVIYCHFTAVIDNLVEKLKDSFTVAKVDGSVTGRKRDEIFQAFRTKPTPRVLIAHQRTVAYGTELAAADQLINDGPQLSGVSTYSQGCDRASSMEQTSERISVIDVYASPEEKTYMESLNQRKSHSDIVSNLFTLIGRGLL